MSAPRLTRRRVMTRVYAGLAVLTVIFSVGPLYIHFFGGGLLPPNPLDRQVTVRFTATKHPDMPWAFSPEQPTMKLHLGETGMAFFDVSNPTARPVAGNATYVVTPPEADRYLVRVACLCGTEQVLQPGENSQIPMGFYVDPAIYYDRAADNIHEITLTYTFHEMKLPADQASAQPDAANNPVN